MSRTGYDAICDLLGAFGMAPNKVSDISAGDNVITFHLFGEQTASFKLTDPLPEAKA